MYFNNFLTMFVAGLWHGSTMMFALWGALHGVALVVHKMGRRLFLDRLPSGSLPVTVLSWLLFQGFLLLTWVFFRAEDVPTARLFLHRIFTEFDVDCIPAFLSQRPLWVAMVLGAMLVHGIRERWFYRLQERFILLPWWCKTLLLLLTVQLAIEFSHSEVQPFLYYKF